MIDLRTCIFLVDGPSEVLALRDKFAKEYRQKVECRVVGCNGRDVKPEGYASAARGTLIVALRGSFLSIACIVDREGRRQSAARFAHLLRRAIIGDITQSTKFRRNDLEAKLLVCVPDIMFENWIVADVEGISVRRDLIKPGPVQHRHDGQSGSSILKRIMRVPYRKIVHCPILFKVISFDRARSNSPSFAHFADSLGLGQQGGPRGGPPINATLTRLQSRILVPPGRGSGFRARGVRRQHRAMPDG